jgi:integrase
VRANRVLSLTAALFNRAIKHGMRTTNPAHGVERNLKASRDPDLTDEESAALIAAIAAYPDVRVRNACMFAMLTGARRGETLVAEWTEFKPDPRDRKRRLTWFKPDSHTKTGKAHKVVLNSHALALVGAHAQGRPGEAVSVSR